MNLVFMNVVRDQRGFLAFTILPIMLVIVFSVAAIFAGAAFAAKKNAVMTYDWFGNAVDFAAAAANRDGLAEDAAAKTPEARQWFICAFSRMIGADFDGYSFTPRSMYPGPIRLVGFDYAPPGTPVRGGGATRLPGYTAVIEVPVIGTTLPFIGPQYVVVPMRYTGVIKPAAER
jgi:hypothetical protein